MDNTTVGFTNYNWSITGTKKWNEDVVRMFATGTHDGKIIQGFWDVPVTGFVTTEVGNITTMATENNAED